MSVPSNLLSANTSGVETNTSGWTAGSNTTLSHSTRFYQGSRSLGMTATASGTVSATTATRVPVVAGERYQAYAFFANVVAASGRTSSVTISWYAGSVGGSPISSTTGDATTLANSTAWNTPPPQVIGVAPAGAAYAALTVTVTGLSAGAVAVADVMTLGLPNAVPGNLYSYNVSSLEADALGWATITNASVDRVQPDAFEGWYSLRQTAAASGLSRVTRSAFVSVSNSTEYVAHAMVKPATSSDVDIEIRWYDAADGYLSSAVQHWPSVPTTGWTRMTVVGKPPVGATQAKLSLAPTATGAGHVWLWDMLALLPAPVIADSLLGYAAQSSEVGVSSWTATGCTIARSVAERIQGVASLAVTTTGPDATVRLATPVPVTPRHAYRGSTYLYHGALAGELLIDVLFTWYTSDGVEIDTGTYRWTTAADAGWYALVGSDVAPDGAASLRVGFRILTPGSSTYYLDEMAVTPGGLGVVADVIPGAYGAEIDLQGLTTGGHTHYGLWRLRDDGAMTAVRGETGDMTAVPITGDLAVAQDYEAPLGVPVRYLVRAFTGSAYLRANSRPVTLPAPRSTEIVVKDPVQPARACTLVVQTMPDWTRSARQGVHRVTGRTTPIVISDIRTSREGTMTVVTATRDEVDRLWWLLETGGTLLVQWPDAWSERDVYVQVGDVTESHIVQWADYSDRAWSIPLTEVDRPIGGLVGSAARTWATVETEGGDWLEILTTYGSWLGVLSGEAG
ncbi:hypothetical protein [Streptomyces sp. NPDC048603]|uniref:hypothetical protein n=1 Tax=Streptomyces sp. NPDC048603 TaxID=3365577 RepID=UPI00371BE471